MYHSVRLKFSPLYTAIALAISPAALADEATTTDEQMVVTATRTANTAAEAPASISVITSDDIDAMPALTLNEIVSQAVGVESSMNGGRAGRELVKIRGLDSSYTLVLLNGRRMSSSNAIIRGNDFDYSSIPTSSIERVEIIRGPMSSLYGSDAMGGVINIITKKAGNEWNSTVRADFQTPENDGGEQYMLGLNTGGALIDDTLFANFSMNYSDRNAWTPFDGDRAEATALEDKEYVNLLGNLSWFIDEQQTLDFDLGYSRDQRESVIESLKGLTDSQMDVRRLNTAFTHTGAWGWGDSQLRYGFERVDLEEGTDDVSEITEDNHILNASASTELGAHRVTFGGELRHSRLDSPRDLLDTGKASLTEQALFVQDEWGFAESWTFTFGGRLDYHEEFGSHFSPRAYLVNRVSDNLVVKGGVGQAFNAPSLLQLNEEYRLSSCKGDCYVIGNPNLKPEESTSYELGAVYQIGSWTTEATLFRNDIKNLIEQDRDTPIDSDFDREVFTYTNVAKARIDGIELAASGDISDSFSLNANYTYTDATDRTTGETLGERPEHTVMARLNWDVSYDLRTFVQYNYTGKQMLGSSAADADLPEDGYSTVDLGLNYYWGDIARIRAGVNNVGKTKMSHEASIRGYNEEDRTWYLGFSSDF
ncbi:TonB-dependent receptor domain-containing protein [Aliagarivorans taiwanensis]|uniref:TonB-dependent receptor domain-containing protein n=1 Tax=Aliagarivorans taiwanensis TaxID=561966 RepID=UPI00047E783D|nr:TonB-dependent receptor [Aliagarivorans taiwanensis]